MMRLVEQCQEKTIFRIVLDVGSSGGVPPWTKWSPLARRFALAPCEVNHNLVVSLRCRDIKHIDE
jgi:hypothetical protein